MTKLKKSIILTVALFLCGNFIVFIGFLRGNDLAITLSRPIGATAWSTSGEFSIGCTYAIVILGISLVLMSIVSFTILFWHWINKD